MRGIDGKYQWFIDGDHTIHLRFAKGSKKAVCNVAIAIVRDIDSSDVVDDKTCSRCFKFMKEVSDMAREEVKGDDSWTTEDSSFSDDWDFWADKATYGYRDEYLSGEVPLLILEGADPDGEVRENIWAIGKGWEVEDGGAKVTHSKGKTRFHKMSNVGMMIDALVGTLGIGDKLRARGEATEAKTWVGIGMHLNRKKIVREGLVDDAGNTKTSDVLLPTTFLGFRDGGGGGATGKAGGANAAPLERKLQALCKLTQEKFTEKAIEMPEVVEDSDLLVSVMDDTEEGYWAKHQKK